MQMHVTLFKNEQKQLRIMMEMASNVGSFFSSSATD